MGKPLDPMADANDPAANQVTPPPEVVVREPAAILQGNGQSGVAGSHGSPAPGLPAHGDDEGGGESR